MLITTQTHLDEVSLGAGKQLNVAGAHELLVPFHGLTLALLILQLYKGLSSGAPIRSLQTHMHISRALKP